MAPSRSSFGTARRAAARAMVALLVSASSCANRSGPASTARSSAPPERSRATTTTVPTPTLGEPCWSRPINTAGLSSPRAADLSGDGLLDVVIGSGGNAPAVIAIDGSTGATLWESRMAAEIYTTAALVDANDDRTLDIAMGGRTLDLVALDGRDGRQLWSTRASHPDLPPTFFGSATEVPDSDGDGTADLLVTQSGNELDQRFDGAVHLVSGRTGRILRSSPTPAADESYSPMLLDRSLPIDEQVMVIGTGGETLPGQVAGVRYRPSADLETVWAVDTGGTIASPTVAHLPDGTTVVLATSWTGEVVAIDGGAGTEMWRHRSTGRVATAPAVYVPDESGGRSFVVATLSEGIAFPPIGGTAVAVWLDAETGAIIRQIELGGFSSNDPVVMDLDDDGRDELILTSVTDAFTQDDSSQLVTMDVLTGEVRTRTPFGGFSAATPLIADLDGDGTAELVHAGGSAVNCYSLEARVAPSSVARQYRASTAP